MSLSSKSFYEYILSENSRRIAEEEREKSEDIERALVVEAEAEVEAAEMRAPPFKKARPSAERKSQEEFEAFATSGLYPLKKPKQTVMFAGSFEEFLGRESTSTTTPVVAAARQQRNYQQPDGPPISMEEWLARLSIV